MRRGSRNLTAASPAVRSGASGSSCQRLRPAPRLRRAISRRRCSTAALSSVIRACRTSGHRTRRAWTTLAPRARAAVSSGRGRESRRSRPRGRIVGDEDDCGVVLSRLLHKEPRKKSNSNRIEAHGGLVHDDELSFSSSEHASDGDPLRLAAAERPDGSASGGHGFVQSTALSHEPRHAGRRRRPERGRCCRSRRGDRAEHRAGARTPGPRTLARLPRDHVSVATKRGRGRLGGA